jgi:micrococcal nuclease
VSWVGLLAAVTLVGIPVWHDGDSGRLKLERVRLAAVNAPELPGSPKCARDPQVWACQPDVRRFAMAARERLRALTIKGLACEAEELDPYERIVVRCRLPDGRDPAAVMVREGLARADRRHGGDSYTAEEALARALRRGVWS